ncbi:unnamed protein product [Cylicocyclus nassatus]|uniref:Uncharacterized protein n=1 Tax=Cylicocyclus nassatus TaxID=53992 RepID=A0AA36GN17_CYLNA|nr:unnamed protein product [Cylicocyclus nassatus]
MKTEKLLFLSIILFSVVAVWPAHVCEIPLIGFNLCITYCKNLGRKTGECEWRQDHNEGGRWRHVCVCIL